MSYGKGLVVFGVIVSVIFVVVGCVWLSLSVETLDEVAEHFGASEASFWNPPIPDYEIPGLEGNVAVNTVVGVAFTLITLTATFIVGEILKAKRKT